MILLNDFKLLLTESIISLIKLVIVILNPFFMNINFSNLNEELITYIKLSSIIVNFSLFCFLFLLLINIIFNFFFKQNSKILKIIKFINLLLISIISIIYIIKFFISLKLEQILGIHIYSIKYHFFINNQSNFKYYIIFSSSFSDAIIILSLITGIICLELLGLKNLFKNIFNINIFFLFNIFVIIMTTTNNLLIMFLSFELIFFPTIYFVYKMGYSKKIDKATEILFYWTLFGSSLILFVFSYIYYNYNSLNYLFLTTVKFSNLEMQTIFILILIGFGIKIPLAPFHFWLLKAHVESPTAFSIFLSGFLVKSSLYCLFMLLNLFGTTLNYFFLSIWIFFSLIVATFGLARTTDIKKLIAWATIQEMTFMLLFLIFKQIFLSNVCILFLVLHGLMSSYMFFIVDILQRRFKTRSLQYIKGLNILLPRLTKHIWFLILLFSGFPLTAKFIIEWHLIILMMETYATILIYVILLVNFLGAIFFCKAMFTIIYEIQEDKDIEFIEHQKKEYILLNFLVFFILLLLWLIYIF